MRRRRRDGYLARHFIAAALMFQLLLLRGGQILSLIPAAQNLRLLSPFWPFIHPLTMT